MAAASLRVKLTVSAAHQPRLYAWLLAVPPGARAALLRAALESAASSGLLPELGVRSSVLQQPQEAPPRRAARAQPSVAQPTEQQQEAPPQAPAVVAPQPGEAPDERTLRLLQRLNRFG